MGYKRCDDITGNVYNRLTVIGRDRNDCSGGSRWLCRCECGNVAAVRAYSLRHGTTKSCGCYGVELSKQRIHPNRKRPYESTYNILLHRCKRRNLDALSYEEYLEFTAIERCHYCHSKIEWYPHRKHNQKSGYHLDRMNNALGYRKDNCVVCCPRCNWGKQDVYTYDEWYGMTEYFRRKIATTECVNVRPIKDENSRSMDSEHKAVIANIKEHLNY